GQLRVQDVRATAIGTGSRVVGRSGAVIAGYARPDSFPAGRQTEWVECGCLLARRLCDAGDDHNKSDAQYCEAPRGFAMFEHAAVCAALGVSTCAHSQRLQRGQYLCANQLFDETLRPRKVRLETGGYLSYRRRG